MIRSARPEDVPAIAELGEEFHASAGWGDIAEYVRADCETSLRQMIEIGILLVAEHEGEIVGMAGGLTFPLYFNFSHRTGQEFFWYMRPSYRNGEGARLLDALEDSAREAGCQSWIMIALDQVEPELMGRLYRSRGYRAAEHSWIRRL
jgi:GNAT superfamily N-acetyltransferase